MNCISHPFLKFPLDEGAVAHDAQLRALLKGADAWQADELVLEEFCLPPGLELAVRADLVVTGASLTGFEIKAGKDRVTRLPAQAEAYGAVCGFANVATVPSHVNDVVTAVPEWWGVWVACGLWGDLAMRCVRSARPNPARDPVRLARMLWREEAIGKLTTLGLQKGTASKNREGLAKKLAQVLSIDEIDALVQTCLRQRPKRQLAVVAKPRVVETPKHELLPRSYFLPPAWQPPVTFQRKPLGSSPILRF
ncbi:sce7726 family protein [Variovorax sp. GB1R11]|uniref:sce7726 family protein n=1 Tax=Variovorax sp. GB1R11 TaxID=3443741 RepID=UPI003F4896D8